MELYTIYSYTKYLIPKDIIKKILEYGYYECEDCKKWYDEGFSWPNDKYKCKYHHSINELYDGKNVINYRFQCIHKDCTENAIYGYRGIICYCENHVKNKKVIRYYLKCNIYDCNKMSIYYNDNFRYYHQHKNNNSNSVDKYHNDNYRYCFQHTNNNLNIMYIDFRHPNNIKSTNYCYDCKQPCEIFYVCCCSIKRCIRCMTIKTYCVHNAIYCYLCSEKDHDRVQYFQIIYFCYINACTFTATHVNYDTQKYSCTNHSTKNQYFIHDYKCIHCNCRAIGNTYCINHQKN
jgi:hypothetical protein